MREIKKKTSYPHHNSSEKKFWIRAWLMYCIEKSWTIIWKVVNAQSQFD